MKTASQLLINSTLIQVSALLLVFLAAACSDHLLFPDSPSEVPAFAGRYIAAISDADMLASAYGTGQLGQPEPANAVDSLSLITLPLDPTGRPSAQIAVSNAVTGPVASIDASPDGRFLYVIEHTGPASGGITTLPGLPPGRKLTAINVVNPKAPTVVSVIDIDQRPQAVDVHPSGNLLVIASNRPGQELAFVPTQNGQLGVPQYFSLAQLGLSPVSNLPDAGLTPSYVEWHPSGQAIAVVMATSSRVVFYQVDQTSSGVRLTPWGQPVAVGRDPFSGRFSPNGRFFITNDVRRIFNEQGQPDRIAFVVERPLGTLTSVELASGSSSTHRVVSTATADLFAEGITINKAGTLIATVNLRLSVYPENTPGFSRDCTVSLFRFDSTTGAITKVDEQPFEGILPEAISFDEEGNNLVVSVFDYFTETPGGALEFWRVNPGNTLQRLNYRIVMGRGVHGVVVGQ